MLERFKQVSARQDRLEELLNRLLEAVEPKALPKDSMLPAAKKKRAP